MPIRELRCPRCGNDVEMGLPRGATVTSITAEGRPEGTGPDESVRTLACRNDHEFFVAFER